MFADTKATRMFEVTSRGSRRPRRPLGRAVLVALVVLALLPAAEAGAVELKAGDILVADEDAFSAYGGVIRVDPATGAQTTVASGAPFSSPGDVAVEADRDILVADQEAFGGPGGVIRVNPADGAKTTVSSGGSFVDPSGIAVEADGDILVADANAFGGGGGVIRVDPATGAQTTVSSGGSFQQPSDIALEADGDILVAENNLEKVIRVDPATGAQTTVASSTGKIDSIAVEADGDILVTRPGFSLPDRVIRVNPSTGALTTLSEGGSFNLPLGIAVEADGDIVVADQEAFGGPGGVIRVNPADGAQTTVSSGGSFLDPVGITVVPAAAPVAGDDAYTTSDNTPLTVGAPGVLGNDSDLDGDPLSAVRVSGPAHGSLTLNRDGTFSYTPATGYTGPDSFTYRTSDGSHTSKVATVSITVARHNDAPMAVADTYTTDEDQWFRAGTGFMDSGPGVLANDSDPDGDPLEMDVVLGAAHGWPTFFPDGSFVYQPSSNFNGTDTFSYRAYDGELYSETVTVTINVRPVNDAPAAHGDTYETDEDTLLEVTGAGVLSNDSDVEGDAFSAAVASGPAHGSLALNPDGSLSYMPERDYNGSDSFEYRASDGADSGTATVTIDVKAANDAPGAAADSYATDEDTQLDVDAAAGVLANDSDVDGDATPALVSGPGHGSLELRDDGSFSYSPDRDYNGTDSFSYRASDATLESEPVTVTIEVKAAQDAPAANGDTYQTDEDTQLGVEAPGVLANDSDPDGDALTATVVSGPGHGSLTLNADGSLSYTPGLDYNGTDSFSYRANDGGLESDPVTVTIDVRPVDDTPPAAPAQRPSGDSASAPPAGSAAPPGGSAAPAQRAIAQLRLAPRCVRPSRSGRVRIRMSLRMARPGPLQIRIDRAVGASVPRSCPSANPQRRFSGRFRSVGTLDDPSARPAATAAAVTRRRTLRLRLSPGLYRISVRAKLEGNRLSAPLRRYLRVLG